MGVIQNEFKLLQMDLLNKATQSDVNQCFAQFSQYATTSQLGLVQGKLDDFVTYDQMIDIRNSQKQIRNEVTDLQSIKNEMVLNIDKIKLELQLKAPSTLLRQLQKSLYDQTNDIDKKIEQMENHQNDINVEIERDVTHVINEVQSIKKELTLKLSSKDKFDLKALIKECALVDDLKELYNKTIPQISKFEKKIIDFDLQAQQTMIIVRRFDQVLAEKANRQTVTEQFQECD